MGKKRIKAIAGVPRKADAEWKNFATTVKEALDVLKGDRGDKGMQAVTFNDLYEAGMARATGRRTSSGSPEIVQTINDPEGSDGIDWLPPTTPRNVFAQGVFQGIQILWDRPVGHSSVTFTEIWRSSDQDQNNATYIGGSSGRMYFDILTGPENITYYYWVRHANAGGEVGPWSDMVTGTKTADPGYLLDELTGKISKGVLSQELGSEIDLISGSGEGSVNQRINQTAASLNENITAVETKATTNAENLSSMYTVKTDVNGYVAGYGLYNSGDTSQFIMRVDTFAIAPPGDEGGEVRYPYVYDGDTGTSYLDTVMIREGSIRSGQIGSLSSGIITRPDGTPVTDNAGFFRSDSIITNNLHVAVASRFDGDVQSDDFVSGAYGWQILQSGYAEFNDATIRGNLEIHTITVNGQSARGGISGRTGSLDDGVSDSDRTWRRDASDSISEMPENSSIDLTLTPGISVTASISGGGYRSPRGDTQQSTGGGSIHITARVRAWVDGSQIYDRTDTLVNYMYSHTGTASQPRASRSSSGQWSLGDAQLHHVYNQYRSSSNISMRIDIDADLSPSGDGHTSASVYVDGSLFSGSLNRLGG